MGNVIKKIILNYPELYVVPSRSQVVSFGPLVVVSIMDVDVFNLCNAKDWHYLAYHDAPWEN